MNRRVLVADDDLQLGLLYRAVLEDAGFEVVGATTGTAALAAVEAGGIDMAVLDVLMPGVSGDAVADAIRVAHPGLPVLLVTGAYGASFAATVNAPVLRKPFPPEELVRAVRRLLDAD
jgi:DNA-binding NtrC family response regulator